MIDKAKIAKNIIKSKNDKEESLINVDLKYSSNLKSKSKRYKNSDINFE